MTEMDENSIDLSKTLAEWALAAGRFLQREETGFVHYFYREYEQNFYTIPIRENILFALALLRSRTVEQVQEAKILLKKILAFQIKQNDESYGYFPVYIHEYPTCTDPIIAIKLLAPFYWILHHFSNVLGTGLKDQIEEALLLLLERCLKFHQKIPLPYSLSILFAASMQALGALFKKSKWEKEGSQLLDLSTNDQLDGWYTTTHLAHILVGLQLVYPSIKKSPWKKLWDRIEHTWHYPTGSYLGPCVSEWQEREEPKPNLYDLFGGYFSGQFSRRSMLIQPLHLQGALIQSSLDKFDVTSQPLTTQGEYKGQKWLTISASSHVYTLLEKQEPLHPNMTKTFTPFRLIWGDFHRVHTFVCQGGEFDKEFFITNDHSLTMIFQLKEESDQQTQKREIEFFVDFHPDIQFNLNRQAANTFECGQELTFNLGGDQLSLCFELFEGQGDFLGHVMRGNRPSQIALKGNHRFDSYDWTIFLRTIRRQSKCKIKATFSFKH